MMLSYTVRQGSRKACWKTIGPVGPGRLIALPSSRMRAAVDRQQAVDGVQEGGLAAAARSRRWR